MTEIVLTREDSATGVESGLDASGGGIKVRFRGAARDRASLGVRFHTERNCTEGRGSAILGGVVRRWELDGEKRDRVGLRMGALG